MIAKAEVLQASIGVSCNEQDIQRSTQGISTDAAAACDEKFSSQEASTKAKEDNNPAQHSSVEATGIQALAQDGSSVSAAEETVMGSLIQQIVQPFR